MYSKMSTSIKVVNCFKRIQYKMNNTLQAQVFSFSECFKGIDPLIKEMATCIAMIFVLTILLCLKIVLKYLERFINYRKSRSNLATPNPSIEMSTHE